MLMEKVPQESSGRIITESGIMSGKKLNTIESTDHTDRGERQMKGKEWLLSSNVNK